MSDIIAAHGRIDHLVTVYCDQVTGRRGRHGSGYPHGNAGQNPVAYFAHGLFAVLDVHVDPEDGHKDTSAELAPRAPRWAAITGPDANMTRNWPSGYRRGNPASQRERTRWLLPTATGTEVVRRPATVDRAPDQPDEDLDMCLRFRVTPHAPLIDRPILDLPELGAVALLACTRCGRGLRDLRPAGAGSRRPLDEERSYSRHFDRDHDGRHTDRSSWRVDPGNYRAVPMTTLAPRLDRLKDAGIDRVALSGPLGLCPTM